MSLRLLRFPGRLRGLRSGGSFQIRLPSEEVRQIQTKLKELGLYTGSIDGIYGSGTKNAVIQFQKQQGLDPDGIAGTKTLTALGLAQSGGGNGQFSDSDVALLARTYPPRPGASLIPDKWP